MKLNKIGVIFVKNQDNSTNNENMCYIKYLQKIKWL